MRFSDALRGAADRAPVDDVSVSTEGITGRIKRERALRMGANGLVGAGAVAVIAFAAMGPLSNPAADMAAMNSAAEGVDSMADEALAGADAPMAESFARADSPWLCGSDFDPTDGVWAWADDSGVTYTVDAPEHDGGEVRLPNTLAAHRTVDMISFADYVITWDGMVVGHYINPETLNYGPDTGALELAEGQVYERLEPGTDFESLEQWVTLNPVNCWDGAALPAGDYEVHQAWTLAYVDDDPEPAVEADESGESSEATLEAPTVLEPFRVAAGPVVLTIDGERVDDPFGDYLNGDMPGVPLPEPLPVEPLPEGSLTPDEARELYEAHAAEGAWDMAAGSQRWVIAHDSAQTGEDGSVSDAFFGCSWDGSNPSFPTRSAELDLLDVNVTLPASIGVSYGFVVDGNPKITSTVTNSSEYTLPGFWGGAQPQLFLVRDGKVAATASPQGIDHTGGLHATTMMVTGEGLLAPGDSVTGDFLLRDIHACDSGSGSGSVTPGTYTVLAAHSLSLSNEHADVARTMEEPSFEGDSAVAVPDMEILPAPGDWEFVELQGWTSLGTITVS